MTDGGFNRLFDRFGELMFFTRKIQDDGIPRMINQVNPKLAVFLKAALKELNSGDFWEHDGLIAAKELG